MSSLPSTGIIIQNCTFQQSIGQAILLSDVNEDVNINHCNFMNNHYYIHNAYGAYGAVIMCIFQYDIKFTCIMNINNGNFSYNENVKTILVSGHVFHFLKNTNFHNNQSVSIHLSHGCILHICEDILFENNVAEIGVGIYISDHSTVTFDESSNAKFINNYVC